jgi:hypothetical protein
MKVAAFLALVLAVIPAFAKDHASQYQVGILTSQYEPKYHTHYLRTSDGLYSIEAPNSIGESIGSAIVTGGAANFVNTPWFMDGLNEGDKVLFASKCPYKRRICDFWLPDPNHPGKEFHTMGHFWPGGGATNTQTLCGKGKLKPEVEAEVCPAPAPAAATPPAASASSASTSAPTTPRPQ